MGNDTLLFVATKVSNAREESLLTFYHVSKLKSTWQKDASGIPWLDQWNAKLTRNSRGNRAATRSSSTVSIGSIRNEGIIGKFIELSGQRIHKDSSSPWGAHVFKMWNFGSPKLSFSRNVIDSRAVSSGYAKDRNLIKELGLLPIDTNGFSKIAKSMMKLTQKGIKFDLGEKEDNAFQLIKRKLYSAPILALPEGSEDFVVYCDASHKGLGAKALGYRLIRMRMRIFPETNARAERNNSITLEDMLRGLRDRFWQRLGWGSPTDWSRINLRNNRKDHPDQAKDASCLGSTKELCRSEAKADRVRVETSFAKAEKLPQELSRVHHTFHVSNLKKCYADEPLVMPLEGIHVDDKLQFVEEPVEIMEREIKRLKRRPDNHWLRFWLLKL
ncbi:putative reverse transcriptase domain-containing protein [Tanacetum coccineum]|uniref:Reverse transcriptase domain-containing protein n=1 Tax=Tanacetum coccineum TaxID=301880 RepID=A0ABQ5F5Z0_9ASTR